MASARTKRPLPSLRTLWAIAKSEELSMTNEDLHAVVERETGKESMRELTQGEINNLACVLQNMKDGGSRDTRSKRTDEGGNPHTTGQRRKIYALCGELGWNNDNNRIQGFIAKMFDSPKKKHRLEWLTPLQCGQVIEALKDMVERQNTQQATEA